ncbi:MAG: hypothetical protein ABW088_00170 [Sedimenticola sp.]
MSYGIESRDYLKRAKEQLKKDTNESLFYAALELRSGIEARMLEYLEVQKHVSKKKRTGWQVAKLARNIEDAFRLGDKDAVLRMRDPDSHEVVFEVRYTPVKRSLREKAEILGNYLHSAKRYYPDDHEYWLKFRELLSEGISELEHANSGRLLGPLLMHPNKKHVDMKLELPTIEEQEFAKSFTSNSNIILEVSYE